MELIKMDSLKIVEQKGKCLGCGSNQIQLDMYDHPNGYPVEGKNEKQWIYYECGTCGYQTQIARILSTLQVRS